MKRKTLWALVGLIILAMSALAVGRVYAAYQTIYPVSFSNDMPEGVTVTNPGETYVPDGISGTFHIETHSESLSSTFTWLFANPIQINDTNTPPTVFFHILNRCQSGRGGCTWGFVLPSGEHDYVENFGGFDAGPAGARTVPTRFYGTTVIGVYLSISLYTGPVGNYGDYTVDGVALTGDTTILYPTATPSSLTATPASVGYAMPCITGTTLSTAVPTAAPTLTPYGNLTPAPTRTPGTPTPTPTRTPIGAGYYDSGIMRFETGVSELSAIGVVNNPEYPEAFLRWSSVTGYDGKPGVVYAHAGMGEVLTSSVQQTAAGGKMIALYKADGSDYYGPVAVSFYARAAYTLTAGNTQSMRVWYFDPDYDGAGNGAWVTDTMGWPSDMVLGNEWHKYGRVVAPTGGSGRITAIALTDERWPNDGMDPACGDYGCVYLDDIHIAYGSAVGQVLAYCPASGTGLGGPGGVFGVPTQAPLKRCVVYYNNIDLLTVCVAPSNALDIGTWISWMWCRVVRFFAWVSENNAQLSGIQTRQRYNEPVGTLTEFQNIAKDFTQVLLELQAQNRAQPQAPIDIADLFDVSALNSPPAFNVPGHDTAFISDCPASIATKENERFSYGACFAIYNLRNTVLVQIIQWVLNVGFVIGFCKYVYTLAQQIAGMGG